MATTPSSVTQTPKLKTPLGGAVMRLPSPLTFSAPQPPAAVGIPELTPLQLPTTAPAMNLSFHDVMRLGTPVPHAQAPMFPSAPVTAPNADFAYDSLSELPGIIAPYVLAVAKLGWPQSLATLVTTFQTTALFIILGMFGGDDAINGIGLGISILYAFSHSFNFGFVATLDTLTSQEYGRKPNSLLMGRQLKAVFMCVTAVTIVTSAAHCFITPIVLRRVFSAQLASGVIRFVTAAPFYPLGFAYVYAIGKFAMNQQQPSIPSAAAVITALLSIPIFYVTLSNAPKEYFIEAAALAFSFVYAVQVGLLLVMVNRNAQTATTLGGSQCALRFKEDVMPVLRLGVPSIPLVGGELAVFNVVSLIAGLLTKPETEAYLIRGNIGDLSYALVYGVAASATAFIGNAMGANKPREARRYIAASLALTLGVDTVNMTIYLLTYPQLYRLYTDDPATLEAAKSLTWPFILAHYGDMTQFCMMMVYCAIGMNHRAAYMSMVLLWGIGVPAIYGSVAVLHVGVFGFMMTLAGSLLSLAAVYFGVLRRYIDVNALSLSVAPPEVEPPSARG